MCDASNSVSDIPYVKKSREPQSTKNSRRDQVRDAHRRSLILTLPLLSDLCAFVAPSVSCLIDCASNHHSMPGVQRADFLPLLG